MKDPALVEINKRLERIEMAIAMMAHWLVQSGTGFNANDQQAIERILKDEKTSIST